MLDCLDLTEIARSFAGGLKPAVRVSTAQQMRCDTVVPSRIRVCYNDSIPIGRCWRNWSLQWHQRLGIHIELVERDYADLSRDDVDATFALRYPAFKQLVCLLRPVRHPDVRLRRSTASCRASLPARTDHGTPSNVTCTQLFPHFGCSR